MTAMKTAYLSLGSNLGDRLANLRAAIQRLHRPPQLRLTGVSSFYETLPVGETPEPVPDYINCAVRVETLLPPLALLEYIQAVEREIGREPTFRWGPRVIDVDILLYDGITLETERLTLPHPRMMERAFALIPLAEIAPDMVFSDGVSLAERLQSPPVREQIVRQVHL
jgi:2-amino-4-hydroxy-6-hydroxymethyldihydropteridine diphosphokinase